MSPKVGKICVYRLVGFRIGETPCSWKILRAICTKVYDRKALTMVTTKWIGKSACQTSNRVLIAHDVASQTERVSIDDEGLFTPSRYEIQSEPSERSDERVQRIIPYEPSISRCNWSHMAHKTYT